MIHAITISGFKSLIDFELELSSFNCLVGLNGSGKSTVLQAFDFISALHEGAVWDWLDSRKWQMSDLSFPGGRRQTLFLQLTFTINSKVYLWSATFNRVRGACTYEAFDRLNLSDPTKGEELLEFHEGKYSIDGQDGKNVDFNFEGSILSALRSKTLGPELTEINNYLKGIKSMDLLSPHLIRQKSRVARVKDIGGGGEKLSVFLHGLSVFEKRDLVSELQKFNSRIKEIRTTKIRGGMIKIEVVESFQDGKDLVTEVKHVNDGLLRLLAIIAQRFSENTFVLYDEIENGVNPEVTQSLLNALKESPRQTLVTTHSPVVLNFLSDEDAKKFVTLIYKRDDGVTRAVKLFDIPMIRDKLDFLAPGEAVIDLPHAALAEEAEAILLERESKKK